MKLITQQRAVELRFNMPITTTSGRYQNRTRFRITKLRRDSLDVVTLALPLEGEVFAPAPSSSLNSQCQGQ